MEFRKLCQLSRVRSDPTSGGFACNQHLTFHGSQKEHAMQKAARVKGPRKKERKGATNKIENG